LDTFRKQGIEVRSKTGRPNNKVRSQLLGSRVYLTPNKMQEKGYQIWKYVQEAGYQSQIKVKKRDFSGRTKPVSRCWS
jgi:hypothetical protein